MVDAMPTMGALSCLSAAEPYVGASPTLLTPPRASASHACPATDALAMPTVGGGGFTDADDGPIPVTADRSRATPAAAVPRRAADVFIEASSENAVWRAMVSQEIGPKNQNRCCNGRALSSVYFSGELRQLQSKSEQISGKTRSI